MGNGFGADAPFGEEALGGIAATVNQVLELDAVLDQILEHLERVIPHDAANVMFIEEGVARVVRGHGYTERGLAEWIEDAGAGLVVERDVESLASAIRELSANPSRAEEMGRKGVRLARERFSWDRAAEEMIRIYASL